MVDKEVDHSSNAITPTFHTSNIATGVVGIKVSVDVRFIKRLPLCGNMKAHGFFSVLAYQCCNAISISLVITCVIKKELKKRATKKDDQTGRLF
tara:strand:- start:45 stop:326 length:282 start_codon:yes stop_codon:yes gene_type:complete